MGIRSRIKGLLGRGRKKAPAADTPKPGEVVRQTGRPKPPPERYRTTKAPERAAPTAAAPPAPRITVPKKVPQTPEQVDKTRRAVLRAKKGTLKYLVDNGGESLLGPMHDHSERRYFIAHRAFSRLMEEVTEEGLVDFDQSTGMATLLDPGRAWLEANS